MELSERLRHHAAAVNRYRDTTVAYMTAPQRKPGFPVFFDSSWDEQLKRARENGNLPWEEYAQAMILWHAQRPEWAKALLDLTDRVAEAAESVGIDSTPLHAFALSIRNQPVPRPTEQFWLTLNRLRSKLQAATGELLVPKTEVAKAKPEAVDHIGQAVLTLRKHPEWSDRQVAKEVGCSNTKLSRSPLYQQAKRVLRQSSAPPARGWTNRQSGEIDATDD